MFFWFDIRWCGCYVVRGIIVSSMASWKSIRKLLRRLKCFLEVECESFEDYAVSILWVVLGSKRLFFKIISVILFSVLFVFCWRFLLGYVWEFWGDWKERLRRGMEGKGGKGERREVLPLVCELKNQQEKR
jgi:hypothetical protein